MTKKEYELSVRANKKSIEQLKADLTTELNNAFNNVDSAGKIKSLSRSDKAAIKADLSSLFGIADEQAEALRKMVQGIIPSDTKSIDHMKVQLQDTLKFATGIMDKMKLLGESTDWMKQGVTFVDKFVGMQSTLLETQKVVSGMQTSIDALTQSFQTFKEALAITSPGAFIDRFGAEVRSVTEDVKKAQSVIDGLRGKQNKGIKQALVVSNEDLQGYDPKMSVEDIRAAHDDIIGEISRYNKKIQELESANKGKMSSLYNNQTYQEYVHGLAVELKNLQSLQQQPLFRDAFADTGAQVGANLKTVTEEISAAAKSAGTELKQVIESLKTDGIKLSVTLPEADGAEFVAKVNDFVNKASAQFKKTPIKIGLDFANPFKSTKAVKKGTVQAKDIAGSKEVFERNATEVGVDAGNSLIGLDTKDTTKIVQGVVESFNKIYAAVKTGQKTITEATKLWQQEMQKYLILKAKFDKTNVEDEAVAMMNQLQVYLDENIPLHLGVDTEELIQEIQKALQEAKFKINIDANNVNGNGVPIDLSRVQFVHGGEASGDYDDHINPKTSESTTAASTSTVAKNSSAVEESTREQRVLSDEIKRLQGRIDANSETIKMSQKANERRAENAKQNSARIEELNKRIAFQQEKREEYSDQRQRHIASRTEVEQKIVTKNKDYVQRSGAVRQAIKDGNIELIQQTFDSVVKSLINERQETLNKLANIDVNDPKNNKTIASYEKTIADIDALLNSDKDQGQIVLDALYRDYKIQQQALQTRVESFQENIDRLTRNIELTWTGQDAAKAEIDKITQEAATERSEMSIQTRQTEFTKAQKRIDNINSVLKSGQSPVTLVLDEVNKFWTQSYKIIERTEKEIAESTEALKKLNPDSKEYAELYQDIQKKQNRVDSWTNRQALMSQKGLGDMRDSELEDAIRTLTEVLHRSPTLSDDLLHNDSLNGLVPIKEIAYYSGIAQSALGFKTQTDKEYVDEQALQAKFVELFRINEFLKKINAMFPKKGAEPKVSDVEAFIKFFEKIPEMSKVVESAKKYLVELKGVSELQAKDATFKTLKEQGVEGLYFPKKAQELWGHLDDSVRTSLGQELATRGVDAKNFASLEDASDAFLQMKNLYKEGVFNSIKTDDAAFGQLVTLLKQSVAIDSSSKEFKAVSDSMATVFDGKLKSILFDAINPDRPLSVRIIGSHGEESVYDIHKPGGAHLNSDRSFSTSSKSLDKFLRRSGLEDQMSRIVSAIFEDPKTAQTLIDDLFSSGKIQLATGKNAFVKKSSQSYSFGSTVLGQNLAEQERLEKEISAAKIGKYGTFLSKRLEGLSTEEQTRIINEFIANKEKELEALRRANLSEREVIQSLLTLEDDIDINAAKQTAARRRSNAAKKRAKRLTEEGTDSFAYKAVLNSSKSDTFNNDYGLARLMSQIDIAGQFGLMDTSELAKLVTDYQEKYERAKQLPKRSQVPNERMGEIDAAWEEVDKARKRLINQYYETDDWYLAQVARDELTTIETEAERSRQQIQSGVTSANSSIAIKKAEIQAQESKSKQFADEYAANLYRKYILEPEEKVQVELSRRNSEIEAKKSEIATRKNDLGRQADLDKGLEALKTEIFKRQSADVELNRLLGLRSNSGIGTPEHTEYNAKIKEIEMRYAAEYNTARKAWIDGKAKELDAEYDAFIDSVKKDAGGDTTKDAIKAFNTDMKGKTTPKKSLSGIKKYIEAVKQQMYKEAEEVTRQTLAGLDTSTGVPQEELDRMLRESREAAAQKKQAFINSIRGKTATELMSDKKGKESVGAIGDAYEAEVALGVELKRQRKAIMDRYGITKEMLDAERSMTMLSEERVSAAKQEEEIVSSAVGGASRSSGGFGTGFVSALNATNLATESTLRGIYELLNGGAPKGGWSNSNNNSTSQVKGNNGGKPVSASDSDHDIKTESDKFVSSVSQLIKTLSARTKYEGAALIGTYGKLGQIISGNEHSVPANKISSALASQVKQVIAVLHNHPSGLSSLSQGDMNAAFARAYGKGVYSGNSPVKVSGSVANGILTSINFNGIDEQVAQQIIDHYNVLLSKLPEQFGEVFKFEGGKLIVSDVIKSDPELRAGVSNILSATIKSAFEKFGHGDAFQQVGVKNIGMWRDSIVATAQQEVTETIVKNGAEVAKNVSMHSGDAQSSNVDISSMMSQGMQSRINRANTLSRYGRKVRRDDLIRNGDAAFEAVLNGESPKDIREKYIWPTLRQQLIDAGYTDTDQFDNVLKDINRQSVWKYSGKGNDSPIGSWLHFGNVKSSELGTGDYNLKAYATFSDIGKLTVEWFNNFLSELTSNGYKGQIKIPKQITGFYSADQLVGHAKDAKSLQILANVLNKYASRGDLSNINFGVDATDNAKVMLGSKDVGGGSFSQLLEEIYGAAPGEVFTVDEIKTIIKTAVADKSGKYGKELFKPIIDDIVAKRAIAQEVSVQPTQQATSQIANAVVEAGTHAAVEAVNSANFTKEDITTRQTAFQEKFKTKELKNGKSGFDIKGANKIDQAFYNVGDRLTKDANELTDSDIKKLQTAYSQLTNGLQEDIVQHLDQDTIEFLNTLKGQISSVLDANSSRLADQTQKLESIKAAKDYLSKLKTEDGKKITGASRAITGIDWTSEILGKDSTNLKDADLKKLALGYHKLQETVNSAIFDTLDKNTKKVINDAIREAKGVLDKYNVTMQGQELVGTVLDASNKDLFDNAAKDKTKKVGRTIKSVAEPQIMRDDRIISHASVYLGKTSKKNKTDTQAQAAAEHQVTQELQQQAQLSTEVAQQGVKAADSAERHAQAAQKVTVSKKENKAVDKHKASSDGDTTPPSTPTSNANVPISGNNQGGFLGALNRIAQEQTLKSIVTLLSKGIKTTSGKKTSTEREKSAGKKSEDTSRITSSEAYDRLMKYASAKYPYITKNSDTVRPNKSGYSMDIMRPKNLKEIIALEERINQLNAEGNAQTQKWAEAQERLNALKKEQEKITLTISADGKTITEKSGLQNLAVGAKAAMKELQNVDATMSRIQEAGLMSISPNGDITSSSSVVQNYLNILKDLQMYTDSLSSKELFDPAQQQKLNDLAVATQKYRKEVIGLINDAERMNYGVMADKLTGGIAGLDDSAINKSMQDIISKSTHLEATFGKFKPILNEFGQTVSYQLSYTLRTGKREVQNMTAALNPLTGEIRVQKGAVESVATSWDKFWGGFKGKFKAITQYIMSMGSIYRVFGIIRQGITYVREIDSALTELKKVTDETAAGYKNFLQDMSQTGAVIGATVTNLTKMASEWARLGYSMEESGKLARSTAILLNVSEFQDATAASEALISTMQAFGYAADESTHVVDVLNEVGNNYAVSSDGIATALQDSASALMEGGNNLEQAVALVAAANKVVQDPNSVGSALRTISLRLRGTSVKVLEEMGESTDGVVASVSKLQGKIKALSGVDILTDSGEYKDTYTILKEIGTVWEDMSDIDQAALLELMAGE